MSTLTDELRADQGKPTACSVCHWIGGLLGTQQAEWDAAMADRSFTHASIHRAILRRLTDSTVEVVVGRSSIERHRGGKHRVLRS